jgi:hypothetical protein
MNRENYAIQPEDVSIVMQGSIVNNHGVLNSDFINNLDMLVKHFPSSQIIISTWIVDSSIEHKLSIKYPFVIFYYNNDVGPIIKDVEGVTIVSNLNRMLISTTAGLNLVTSRYAIKIRTDSFFYSDNILQLFKELYTNNSIGSTSSITREVKFSIFNKHIINCNLFARNPHSHLPFLFHPGDIMLAGETADLKLLFHIPLADDKLIGMCKTWMNSCYMVLVPEQYLWIKCIEINTGMRELDGNFSSNPMEVERSERFYLNNFIPLSPEVLGFEWPKHKQEYYGKGILSVYTFKDWVKLYQKYILLEKSKWDFQLFYRDLKINFMKLYFFIRTQLLRIKFIRKLAFKLFVKRGSK